MTKQLLGLPVSSRRATSVSALALFAYYALTMCRSLSMYDSPELALVAEQLGLGHPFGQPLHTLLGALVARLPGIDPLIALNGLSALAGALTVVPATSFAEALLRPDAECPRGDTRLVAPTIALIGVHSALWEPSTRIEVYSLAVFFALWAAARFVNAVIERDSSWHPYLATGLALGLSAGANPICAFGVALAMTPRLFIAALQKEIPRTSIAWVTLGGLMGLAVYVYVFIVAGRQDVLVWGAPTTATSILHYFSAADFRDKAVASWSGWVSHFKALLTWSLYNGLVALWLAGFAGFALYVRRRGLGRFFYTATLFFFLAFVARNGVFATDVLDYAGYLSIPTWLGATGSGLFVAYLGGRNAWGAAGAIAAVLVLVMISTPAPNARTRHLDSFTEDIALEALEAAPADAILIVGQDHWIAPMLYLQERRPIRPDVVLLPYGLAASEWYWDFLFRRHPGLQLIELRAPGGRDARIRRLLRANPERPVQVERVSLATRLGLPTCPSEWLLDVRDRCRPSFDEPALARSSAAALAELGNGSPGTDGLIALVTLQRGHDLYSQGLPRAAIATLLAGTPRFEGLGDIDLSRVPKHIEPATRPVPLYEPRVALGDAAQNLHYASVIARATGAEALGRQLWALSNAVGPVEPKFAPLPASPDNL